MENRLKKYDHSLFQKGLSELGMELTEEQLSLFDSYYELLVEKNKVMNLTGITEYGEVVTKHFLDSLSLVKVKELAGRTMRVLDLGTGAGFPGLPLKIAFPELHITLMDSLNKRILFLQEVIDLLGLSGITAVHARAEEAARRQEYREAYDLCVSRAVAKLNSLSEFCLPFVRPGGCFIPYKSGTIEEELSEARRAIRELGGRYQKTERFFLPDSTMERTLLVILKERETPGKYPRAGGKPLKQPIV